MSLNILEDTFLNMELYNNLKIFLLTIDYEIFLGTITGTVKECMIEPTEKLLKILDNSNSKMTVFWDILHYYKLNELADKFPELQQDKQEIENQIIKIVKAGHDVQLHIHPHWLDAQYQNGKWIFQYNRFNLHNLSNENRKNDINTITGCISIAKDMLENLIRQVNTNYKVTTFRAGGYLIEPFEKISDALIANEINIDSSVCPGRYKEDGFNAYDFHDYPKNLKYNFAKNPKVISDKGNFIEIPIATIEIPLFRNIYYKLLRKYKYSSLRNSQKGLGAVDKQFNKQKSKFKKFLSLLIAPHREQFTTDFNFREKFNYLYRKVPGYSTLILHPKLLNNHTLNILEHYLTTNKIHFISIKDFNSK